MKKIRILSALLLLPTLSFGSGIYNPGSGGASSTGGGIVSPGTFTWVNTGFGIQASTISVSTITVNGQIKFNNRNCLETAPDGTCILSMPSNQETFLGYNTNQINNGGTFNTAYGAGSIPYPNTGNFNNCFGNTCMGGTLLSGENNNGMGYAALGSLRAGFYNNGVGGSSLNLLQDGSQNTAVGGYSSNHLVSGSNTTAIGYRALFDNLASDNMGIGFQAGTSSDTANASTNDDHVMFFGSESGRDLASATTISNAGAMGYRAYVHKSNSFQMGGQVGSGNEWEVIMASLTVPTGQTTLQGVSYKWPSSQASGTKILSNDGSGNLSWQPDATSAGGGDNLGNGTGSYGIATTTAGFTAMNVTSTSATVTGVDGFRTAFGITGTTLTLTNSSTVGALKITQTGNVGASSSVGGAVNITNTSNTGAGLVIYSNQSTPTDNLMGLRVDSNGFNQNALFVDYRGSSNAVTIRSSTTATSYALNLVGQSTATSTFQASGAEASVATFKITHSSPTLQPGQSDVNASAVSIALAGVGTQAQGLFIDATGAGGTTGKLMNIRNGGEEFFTLSANKNVTAKYGLTTTTFTVNTEQYGVASITGNYTATSTATVILADATGASLTVTLPTAVGWTGGVYRVKRLNSGANTVTVATTSAQTIDGATTQVLSSQYTAVDLISDGANWSLF